MLFYTTFIIKELFNYFGEVVEKNIETEEMSYIFSQLCLHVDWLLREM